MLSDIQKAEFQQAGVVRLTGVFSEADAHRMCQKIWDHLAEKHGIRPDNPATWTIRQPTGFQALTRSRAFNAIATPLLENTLDQILGEGAWEKPDYWGAPLVTFPGHSPEWQVPKSQWHLDFSPRGRVHPLPGVRVLAFLAPVAPRGGGTLVVQGSHTLVERLVAAGGAGRGHSTEVRNVLARASAWFRNLWANGGDTDRIRRFMTEGDVVDGVAVRVIELTGSPGDVILMHPWAFHAPSPNCGTTPRVMMSHSVFRAGALAWEA
ncbi:MAG: phytanoyl-CoA dioxygenase family protein [Anaerolineae bacterium]|nr:phytanoyl-CoA dioxygenase family protein [Anaerolineae bacterium]